MPNNIYHISKGGMIIVINFNLLVVVFMVIIWVIWDLKHLIYMDLLQKSELPLGNSRFKKTIGKLILFIFKTLSDCFAIFFR